MQRQGQAWRNAAVFAGLLLCPWLPAQAHVAPAPVAAPVADAADLAGVERDPLELRALREPDVVLRELGPALNEARMRGDERRIALLQLARANACRVVADWDCQRNAGAAAAEAALAAGAPLLQVRGLIAEARGRIAEQDYGHGERLLAEAQRVLAANPQPELFADIMLAYSSMSFSLGKSALSADYARRGLAALPAGVATAMQARLLRNLARAQAQRGEVGGAAESLREATSLAREERDPKLEAELYLEAARLARIGGDQAGQRRNGERVLALAERLKNSQVGGLGHEVMGLAAQDARDFARAEAELRLALDAFASLGLDQDELRVLRELIQVLLAAGRDDGRMAPLVGRYLALDAAIEQATRGQAYDDFAARLRYAEQEFELRRLQAETALERERNEALVRSNQLSNALGGLGVGMLVVLAAFFFAQRRGQRQQRELLARLRASETGYRMLADNASDLVLRFGVDGTVHYVSPSCRELLGMAPEAFAASPRAGIPEADLPQLHAAFERIAAGGEAETVLYRQSHANGVTIWLEGLMRRVDGAEGQPEVMVAARDVSVRVRAEQALAATQYRLRAITDNIPALIAHIDTSERFSFMNAYARQVMGVEPETLVGRTVREVRGDALYAHLKPYLDRALAGETTEVEGSTQINGKDYDFHTTYVPDRDAQGRVVGVFSFTYDITALKQAERQLDHLARVDAMTDLANRRQFDERLAAACARAGRQGAPLALLFLDIDHFKAINDSRGHAAGDAVIREFARRLRRCVRIGDLVARLGGDEFAVLVEGAVDRAAAESIAAKLLERMREPVALPGGPLQVGASIGIAMATSGAAPEPLLAAADHALYAAKAAGRGAWRSVDVD
ncbi:hypothetical protein N790_01730 [Arenimonas malthae CC-JY-1]|uniref:Diguanylate cyclase n=1 Tax=Arenimonas malthae CC-JY-1 TaxID=1384054 RepID=A0A091B9H8_9GAMM|nr:diguanylate cyclase [Arenimonas malthae]KFN47454.1 hypothetical protein N790_01730 [Arenimonas malthae CC-JY-1]